MRSALATILASTLVSACSSGDGATPPPPGCDDGAGACISGSGLTAAICANVPGTFLDAGCPSTNRVAVCTNVPDLVQPGTAGEITYYDPQYDAPAAVSACAAAGGDYGAVCPSDGGTTMTVHCVLGGDMCHEVYGSLNSCQTEQLSAVCAGEGWTYAAGGCPYKDVALGYCERSDVGAVTGVPVPGGILRDYYYVQSWTLQMALGDCSNPPAGTWY